MYFNDASRSPMGQRKEHLPDNVHGIGTVFVSSYNALIEHSFPSRVARTARWKCDSHHWT